MEVDQNPIVPNNPATTGSGLCLLSAIAIMAVVSGCASQPPRQQDARPGFYASLAKPGARVSPAAVRDIISIYRRNNGLALVRLDPALQRAAEIQAQRMVAQGGAGNQVRKGLHALLRRQKISFRTAVQNVSSGYHTLPEAFAGWRQSAPHNSNMLNRRVTRMGVASIYAPDTKYKVHWVLVMAD